MRRFTLAIACAVLLGGVPGSLAHLQIIGSKLDVTVQPDRFVARAEIVSQELPMPVEGSGNPSKIEEAEVAAYGEYLLSHVSIYVDGKRLSGRVTRVDSPENPWKARVCEMEFVPSSPDGWPAAGSRSNIEIRQTLLEDRQDLIELGVVDICYVVNIGSTGRKLAEGLLLTREEVVSFDFTWPGRDDPSSAPESNQQPSDKSIAGSYIRHGIHHILSGYDHLLFIALLVLAARSLWDLVKVVSVFTLAHTVTLCLAAADLVRVPGSIVEPFIAASIVFVAVQNVFWPSQSHGKARLWTAFFFGLFHGLGFAGGLLEAMQGMTGQAVLVAVASFSLGVEIGHQVVVLPLYAFLLAVRGWEARQVPPVQISRRIVGWGSAFIAVAGIFYLFGALDLSRLTLVGLGIDAGRVLRPCPIISSPLQAAEALGCAFSENSFDKFYNNEKLSAAMHLAEFD